ncbi:MAG: tRNA 4-thiouridine(8) synthase ThiI [Candidatus Omnitrophota bacterium]
MKAIALISGGLDSLVAAAMVKDQGVAVAPLYFKTPFCKRDKNPKLGAEEALRRRLEGVGLELETADISGAFLDMLRAPRYGFGSNMNPCIDCKILMLARAREFMPKMGASFVFTGEVLGQRPMSQNRRTMELIEESCGLKGLLLRPLSARLLEETIPEKEGWLRRDKLLGISGRGRRPQMELARSFGIKDYPNAAGGCLLTDSGFSGRLKELINHRGLNARAVEALKVGRHFRLSPRAKLIVGRNEEENNALVALAGEGDYLFMPADEMAGPNSVGLGEFGPGLIELSCAITCRYCDLQGKEAGEIFYRRFPQEKSVLLSARPLDDKRLAALRI